MRKFFLSALLLSQAFFLSAQNLAINTDGSAADASAALHIKSTTKGLLIPTMTATERGAISSPAKGLMVYQTDGSQGFYYNSGTAASPNWTYINPSATNTNVTFNSSGTVSVTDGSGTVTSGNQAWLAGGNNFGTTGSANAIGTINNDHINLITNNQVRGRLSNLGEFFIGSTNTVLTGDLMNGVSNATFPWAVNGYSSFNGSGVFGVIQGGTTKYAGVQGEYQSNSAGIFNTAAVRGVNSTTVAGTGFRTTNSAGPQVGVIGSIPSPAVGSAPTYSFGVHGSVPNTASVRSGGLFGDDGGFAMGAVGYFGSDLNDYSFYAFGNSTLFDFETGGAGGRVASTGNNVNTHIGMGIYGGVMGGWIRGQVYGAHIKGNKYSLYVDGTTYTNKPITQLIETADGSRLPTYTTTSLKTDVTARGKAALQNGAGYVAFDAAFKQMISENPEEITVTVTPVGNSNGVYISGYDATGFWVKENSNGTSNVAFTWIAIGTRKGYEEPQVARELLDKDFDKNMNGVMHHELNTKTPGRSIWWDGTRVRFDRPPARVPSKDEFSGARPTEIQQ